MTGFQREKWAWARGCKIVLSTEFVCVTLLCPCYCNPNGRCPGLLPNFVATFRGQTVPLNSIPLNLSKKTVK